MVGCQENRIEDGEAVQMIPHVKEIATAWTVMDDARDKCIDIAMAEHAR
jgi:hypothetical protein